MEKEENMRTKEQIAIRKYIADQFQLDQIRITDLEDGRVQIQDRNGEKLILAMDDQGNVINSDTNEKMK